MYNFEKLSVVPNWRVLVSTSVIVAVSWLAAVLAKPEFGQVAAALLFVLGVVIAGAVGGLAGALIAATAAFLLYNFYLAEPVLDFHVATGRDIMPLIIFSLCAVVAGGLSGRLKDRAKAADDSNSQLISLLWISRALQSAVKISDIDIVLAATDPQSIATRMQLFLLRDDTLREARLPQDSAVKSRLLARSRDEGGETPVREGHYVAYRLDSREGHEGTLLFENTSPRQLAPAYMSALANLIALAVERASLSERDAERRALVRTEELKTALLSSVSHDFRTPLTAIIASASSLIDFREQLDVAATLRLLKGIIQECERLNRYTANLLEMSRLEAGQAIARQQTLGVAETLSAVVQRVRPRAGNRQIERGPCDDALQVYVDAALFELVLINVIDNAITYSDDFTRIRVDARLDGDWCAIVISDQGQGIPSSDLERIFDRFYRVPRAEPSPRGSGLGLAIAKGFVEALGGQIAAQTPGLNGRGTAITISLPVAQESAPS